MTTFDRIDGRLGYMLGRSLTEKESAEIQKILEARLFSEDEVYDMLFEKYSERDLASEKDQPEA